MTQGQSRSTEDKIRGFGSVFAQQLKMFNAINSRQGGRFTYFHFDCHAGCGENAEVGIIGSPMLFVDQANRLNVPFLMCAIDKDLRSTKELSGRLLNEPRAFVFHGDNGELVRSIPDIIQRNGENTRFAVGSILLDPNNQRACDIPWDAIRQVTEICPRIDVVFNFPIAQMKRVRHLNGCDYVKFSSMPERLHKNHLLVRERVGHFMLVVGRNMPTGDHRSMGFHGWDSNHGKILVHKADMTKKEYDDFCGSDQGTLWPDT